MNKAILMGRLTRDPEVRYSQSAEPLAIARYSLAVNKRFKREGEPDADFINIVAFGKAGQFAENYFKKGMQVAVVGRIQVRSYDDKEGNKRWVTEVVAEEQNFTESKRAFEDRMSQRGQDFQNAPTPSQAPKSQPANAGFVPINDDFEDDDDLPF